MDYKIADFVIFNRDKNESFFSKTILDLKQNFTKIIFVTDEKIWKNCQKFFSKDFLDNFAEILFLENPKADEKNLQKILTLSKNVNFILGFGSGTINDLCKFCAAKLNINYGIFASAPSMNGYLSKNASITINNHKKTLLAKLPYKIYCDLQILSSAPNNLKKAGIGDALCFYSCWFDWYLSHKILGRFFEKKPFEILQDKMEFFVKNYQKFSLDDEEFLEILMEILLISGLGMTIVGGSYPASQSEHLISHAIEMKHKNNSLHGQQIAVTTVVTSKIQGTLLEKWLKLGEISQIQKGFFLQDEILQFFGEEIMKECEAEYREKIFEDKKLKEINKNIAENYLEIIADLQKIYFPKNNLIKIFEHFKIDYSAQSLGISKEEFSLCQKYAKYIRNRFTCLDLI